MNMAAPAKIGSLTLSSRETDDHFVLACERLGCKTLKALNEMRAHKTFCDVTIKASGVEVLAHKNILSVHSDFFKAMFSVEMIESQTQTATFKDINHEIMSALVDYMYTGILKVTRNRVQDVLVVADMLQMVDVKRACVNFMLTHLDIDNCIGIFNFSEQYNCEKLKAEARQVMKLGFSVICLKEEFLQLSAARLEEMLSWSDVKLGPQGEDVVLEAVVRWLRHDVERRRPDFTGLLQYVRLHHVSEKCYENILQNELFVQNKDLEEAIITERNSKIGRPSRTPPYFVFVFAGCLQSRIGFSSPRLRTVEKLDIRTNRWTEVAQIPKGASIIDVFNIAGRLLCFVCRAHDSSLQVRVSFAELYEYKFYVNKWEQLDDAMSDEVTHCLLESHFEYGAHIYNEAQRHLYIVTWRNTSSVDVVVDENSCDGDVSLRQIEQLPVIDAFSEVKHRDFKLVVCGGRLYCLGGMRFESLSERYVLSSTYVYHNETRSWISKADMLQGRASFGVVELDGSIYVMGGFCGQRLKLVEKYNTATDTWTALTSMSKERTYMAAVTMDSKIYVMGGQSYSRSMGDGRKVLASCEIYDPSSDTWTLGTQMLTARCLFDAVAV